MKLGSTQYYAVNKKTGLIYNNKGRAVYNSLSGLKGSIENEAKYQSFRMEIGMESEVYNFEDFEIKTVTLA